MEDSCSDLLSYFGQVFWKSVQMNEKNAHSLCFLKSSYLTGKPEVSWTWGQVSQNQPRRFRLYLGTKPQEDLKTSGDVKTNRVLKPANFGPEMCQDFWVFFVWKTSVLHAFVVNLSYWRTGLENYYYSWSFDWSLQNQSKKNNTSELP
jgi:hypothetical protein